MTNDEKCNAKVGFQVGVGMEYAFNNSFAIQPSLLLTTKGTKSSLDGADVSFSPMYLELPIMAAYRVNAGNNFNVVLSAGPYIAYGVGGSLKVGNGGVSVNKDLFGSDGLLNNFDAGLGIGVGFELSHFVIGINGEIGLANTLNRDFFDQNSKNVNLGITLGYKF